MNFPKSKVLVISVLFGVLFGVVSCGGSGGNKDSQTNNLSANQQSETEVQVTFVDDSPALPSENQIQTEDQENLRVEIEPETAEEILTLEDEVAISGKVSFDLVTHLSNGALNYSDIIEAPAKGVTVQLLDRNNNIVDAGYTDDLGSYTLIAPINTDVRVRVRAELKQEGEASWDFKVTDNTNSNALYVMDGSLYNTGEENSTRNLHAPSGWENGEYRYTRTAGPFAILDAVHEAIALLRRADENIQLEPSEFRWSVDNVSVFGKWHNGEIGTSFYDPNSDVMYILGRAGSDTDEYDRSVIQHEFSHYLEDTLSRSDNIGGSHSLLSILDMRVAFGEGFANAFTAIASGSGIYEDAYGTNQDIGFRFSLEKNSYGNKGWFNENSVGKIIYDIYDSVNEGNDTVALGFKPIYEVLTSPNYINNPAFTSIFLFAQQLKSISPISSVAGINELLQGEEIFGEDEYGSGETNDGGMEELLPVYKTLSVGGSVNVCSNNNEGEYNNADSRDYVRYALDTNGTYNVSITKSSGSGAKDPDARVFKDGEFLRFLSSNDRNRESKEFNMESGHYVLDIFEHSNIDEKTNTGGKACFDVTLN